MAGTQDLLPAKEIYLVDAVTTLLRLYRFTFHYVSTLSYLLDADAPCFRGDSPDASAVW